jgi:bacteriocin-type transport-associated protein
MIDIFLNQLSNSDIQWLKRHGRTQRVRRGETLIDRSRVPDYFYLLIGGETIGTIPQNQGGILGRAFAALEDDEELEQEIARFAPGEVLGKVPMVELTTAEMTVIAAEDSAVLAIAYRDLAARLSEDYGFAARFYRAIAMLLLDRFDRLVQYFLRPRMGNVRPLIDAPLVFGELSDGDVDWMLGVGRPIEISTDRVLIEAGEQIEYLYIILKGTLAVFAQEKKSNRLLDIFAKLEGNGDAPSQQLIGREIAHLCRGEIVGENITLDNYISNITVKALENSILLRIPQQQLTIKLQQDVGTAVRFYRVQSMLLSGRLQGLIARLGYGRNSYEIGQSLNSSSEYEDELSLDAIDNLTLGGARFDWMLRRLTV